MIAPYFELKAQYVKSLLKDYSSKLRQTSELDSKTGKKSI